MRRGIIGWGLAMIAAPAAAQSTGEDATAPSIALPAGPQAAARPGAADGRQTYPAAYFAPYAPSNALQIVERVPGFDIESGDEDVRGFAQAAGNVVINGQRPSTKSETVETILARIPASRVLSVELGSGDLFGAEYSGKPQVLNLVLATGGGLAGTVEGSLRRDFLGDWYPEGTASLLLRTGPSSFNLSITADNERTSEEGIDRVLALPSGALRELRRKVNEIDDPNVALAGGWDYNGGANRTAHLNARGFIDRFQLEQYNDVFPAGGTVRDDRLSQSYDLDQWEVGGDVTRPFAGGGIKLIGLANRRYRTNLDLSLNRVAGRVTGGSEQVLESTREESVLRLVWNRADLLGWSVETGAEGAINRLVSDVDLRVLGAGGGWSRIDLPVDHAVVKERRGEGFVNVGRLLSPQVRIDLGLTYEASRLTVRGDASAERTLNFLKPRMVLDWRPAATRWHLQLLVQRTVAQLQFEDFISSAELTNERINGGNANLLPQRAWESLLTIDRPILGDGLLKLELGYNKVSLVQDRVPTPEGFDAPGNLGDGRTLIARSRIDAPLAGLIKGGRLTLYGSLVSTSVRDPYTGRNRRFSGNSLFYGEASFRQDLGSFAWGLALTGSTAETYYRRDEEDSVYSIFPQLSAFAEYRPDARSSVRLSVDNLAGTSGNRERFFYAPDRRTSSPSAFEYRERNRHLVPAITVKRSFG